MKKTFCDAKALLKKHVNSTWRVDGSIVKNQYGQTVAVSDIKTMVYLYPSLQGCYFAEKVTMTERAQANARLIAHAPAMLTALLNAEQALKGFEHITGASSQARQDIKALCMAIAGVAP